METSVGGYRIDGYEYGVSK